MVEAAPPSPSVFPGRDDDLVLPYISRMLMEEEDVADQLSYQYDPDDPALLQAQQPFAEILSNSNAAVPTCPCSSTVDLSRSPQPPATDTVDTNASLLLPADESSGMDVAVTMAFFRGMDEASKFLPIPGDKDSETAGGSRRKKRLDGDDMGSRSSKQLAPPLQPESEEEVAAREMLHRLMLNGYDDDTQMQQQELDAAATAKEMLPPRRGRRRSAAGTKRAAVDLHTLLIRCAEAVAANDRRGSCELLERIKQHSSPTGDGTQRLAHCFAEALEARLAGAGGQVYRSLIARRASAESVVKAYQLHMSSCCFVPVKHLFANATIYNAVAGRRKLHIVHYGLGRGLQWPDLLRRLARRDGGPPEVRLTGIDDPQSGFRPAQRVEETGRLLGDCARRFGVPFEFRGIAASSEAVRVEDLDLGIDDEVLAVNSILHFQNLMDESVVVERPNPRDVVLGTISRMRPSVFIHGICNGSHNSAFFMTRFREALHSYTAMFDMMDAIAARSSEKRLLMEQEMFARCVTNIVACEGADRVARPQSYKQWQARSRRAGLRQLPLDPAVVQMVKDKVSKAYHRDFVISEDQRWLLQGWKGRVLYALSTWTADDDVIHTT